MTAARGGRGFVTGMCRSSGPRTGTQELLLRPDLFLPGFVCFDSSLFSFFFSVFWFFFPAGLVLPCASARGLFLATVTDSPFSFSFSMRRSGTAEPGRRAGTFPQILLWDTLPPSSPKPIGREILRLSCTNTLKYALLPAKHSLAAIPPGHPLSPLHLINLGGPGSVVLGSI